MLLLLALAARDPGALCSVGRPMQNLPLQNTTTSSWLFEPTNVDSGLNNYRTLLRLPANTAITTHTTPSGSHAVNLDLKFLAPSAIPTITTESLELAEHFMRTCTALKHGRNRKRYLTHDPTANALFGSMADVYVRTLACVFDLGPDWLADISSRYGVARWKSDLHAAVGLLVALKNTGGKWPAEQWGAAGAGFVMDFANFLVIRGMPQRQVVRPRGGRGGGDGVEEWRPIWVAAPGGGKVLTFVPPGEIRVAVPTALLDEDYIHLARLWVLRPRAGRREPRGGASGCSDDSESERSDEGKNGADGIAAADHINGWTLLGKSVLFGDHEVEYSMEDAEHIRTGQRVFGREAAA